MGYTPYAPCRYSVTRIVVRFQEKSRQIFVASNGYNKMHNAHEMGKGDATGRATEIFQAMLVHKV